MITTFLRYCLNGCMEGLRKTIENLRRVIGVLAMIQNWDLLNVKQEFQPQHLDV
jgi:hypothetical protein